MQQRVCSNVKNQ